VREVRVHEDDKVARAQLQAVDVGGAEAELARALEHLQLLPAVDALQLERDGVRAVGRRVLDDDDLVRERRGREDAVEQRDHQREVLALVVAGAAGRGGASARGGGARARARRGAGRGRRRRPPRAALRATHSSTEYLRAPAAAPAPAAARPPRGRGAGDEERRADMTTV